MAARRPYHEPLIAWRHQERPQPVGEISMDAWASLAEAIDRVYDVLDAVQRKALDAPTVPEQRRYTLEEVGVRIVQGTDPQYLPEERQTGISRRTVQDLINAGVLGSQLIGGQRFVTELQVQYYESAVARGAVDGYKRIVAKRQNGQPGRKPKSRRKSRPNG